jgi:beta-glucosidase
LADVLFGDYNPAGRLPITVPRSVGQLPDYYYQKPSAKREFLGSTTEPLFIFGWGLSYTTFAYDHLRLAADHIGPEGTTKALVDVKNTGPVRGDEVAQLYIRDEVSSVTRPVKELRGFRRLSLAPGETKTIEFLLGPDELSFLNRDMHRVVEPGTFKVMVGGNSSQLTETKLTVDAK